MSTPHDECNCEQALALKARIAELEARLLRAAATERAECLADMVYLLAGIDRARGTK